MVICNIKHSREYHGVTHPGDAHLLDAAQQLFAPSPGTPHQRTSWTKLGDLSKRFLPLQIRKPSRKSCSDNNGTGRLRDPSVNRTITAPSAACWRHSMTRQDRVPDHASHADAGDPVSFAANMHAGMNKHLPERFLPLQSERASGLTPVSREAMLTAFVAARRSYFYPVTLPEMEHRITLLGHHTPTPVAIFSKQALIGRRRRA